MPSKLVDIFVFTLEHIYCGFDVCQACLDVVYITDGKSNDPNLEVCETLIIHYTTTSIHNAHVNVYAFAKMKMN